MSNMNAKRLFLEPSHIKARILRDRLNGMKYRELSDKYCHSIRSLQVFLESAGCKGEDFQILKKGASVRKCLSCASVFASFNVGHRLCDNCITGAGIENAIISKSPKVLTSRRRY